MPTIEITCKDPLIEKHCRETVGPRYQRLYDAEKSPAGRLGVLYRLRRELRVLAEDNEWYDYVEEGEPTDSGRTGVSAIRKRTLLRNVHGRPKLLIPHVRVMDQ